MSMRLVTFVLCASFILFGSSCNKNSENSVTVVSAPSLDDPKAPVDPKVAEVRDSESSGTVTFNAPLDRDKEDAISKLWESGQPGEFKSLSPGAGVTIRYRIFEQPKQSKQKAAVVISSGRTECMFKYDETIYDLYQKGYSVYIHDHRGQGFSGRTIATEELPAGYLPEHGHGPGHVNDFNFYVQDLHQFVTTIVQPSQHDLTGSDQNLLLLGHSMGGCIASLYIEAHTKVFRAAVLCSPMHEPDVGLLPGIAVKTAAALRELKGQATRYAGKDGGPYKNEPFEKAFDKIPQEDSALTHSAKRYERVRTMFEKPPEHKETRVGGASYGWVHEAINAADDAIANAGKIEIDVLLLQATDDIAVTPEGQFKFRDALNAEHPKRCELVPIEGYHELLIESDTFRNKAMGAILTFFAKHAAGSGS